MHTSKISIRPTPQEELVIDGYLALIKGVTADLFSVLVRNSQCSLRKTSSYAADESCIYAVNGGVFKSYINGGCIGLVISNGQVIHSGYGNESKQSSLIKDDSFVGFGVTYKNEWVLGDISSVVTNNNPNEIQRRASSSRDVLQVKEFINGLGWLVKDNEIVPTKHDSDAFAPRTAIGVDIEGNIIMFQVDGCERCLYSDQQRRGLTLNQMAVAMASPPINATFAVNLDGGGSSTSVMNGKVLNKPTCLDYTDWKCERPVGSVVCIRGKA